MTDRLIRLVRDAAAFPASNEAFVTADILADWQEMGWTQAEGQSVADLVSSTAAAAVLSSQPSLAPVEPAAAEAGQDVSLYGSSVQPSILDIQGKRVQLGGLVVASFKESGLTPEAWNELAAEEREFKLELTLERLSKDAEAFAAEVATFNIIGDTPDKFEGMTDDQLRAFITERDGKAPHHMTGRPNLLKIARNAPAAA